MVIVIELHQPGQVKVVVRYVDFFGGVVGHVGVGIVKVLSCVGHIAGCIA